MSSAISSQPFLSQGSIQAIIAYIDLHQPRSCSNPTESVLIRLWPPSSARVGDFGSVYLFSNFKPGSILHRPPSF